MKRRILALVFALGVSWAQPAAATWTFLNSATCTGSSGCTTGAASTTGATLIVVSQSGIATLGALSDSASNTWTALTEQIETVANYRNKLAYVSSPTTSGTHTFTTTASFAVLNVMWFSGTFSSFDNETGAHNTSGSIQPGSLTPVDSDELFIAGVTHNDGSSATINSSFNTPIGSGQVGGNNAAGNMSYKIKASSSSAENPTWTATVVTWATTLAAFRTTGAGGATSHPCGSLRLLGVGCNH